MFDGGSDKLRLPPSAIRPVKVRVKLEDNYRMLLQWTCRQVAEDGALEDGDLLVMNPKALLDENGEPMDIVARGWESWALLPGDLVSVEIPIGVAEQGFYAPLDALVTERGKSWVFAVRDGRAKRIAVELGERVETVQRVSASDLRKDDDLIVFGRYYVNDGDEVVVSPLAAKLASSAQGVDQ